MLTAGTVWAGFLTYALMFIAFKYARRRALHVPIMVCVTLFDFGMPFYLYLYKGWYRRLIIENELTSFLVWIHFMMLVMMYALYVMQVKTALRMLQGDHGVRTDHRVQGKALLLVRAMVIFTGALLVEQ